MALPLLAVFRSDEPAKISQPGVAGLTFEERVSYQRAIEEVYWRHRIWPKERKDPKPSLDAVVSQEQLEKKVIDYLRNSKALEDYWERPITADQLQAEMDRMAKHTRQPEVLRELFEALGNDPFVIAECLARPALTERLLRGWYAHDQRIHGDLRERANADLKTHPTVDQMRQTSGRYSEIEFVKNSGTHEEVDRDTRHAVTLNKGEWDETVQKLARIYNGSSVTVPVSPAKDHAVAAALRDTSTTRLKTGVLSPLQEDEERYYATAVIEETNDRLSLATVAWFKEPLESWLARAEDQVPNIMPVAADSYALPKISDGADECIDDTWTSTVVSAPPSGLGGHSTVWTGSEMIIWGGVVELYGLNTGWKYNLATDSWVETSTTNAPDGRTGHTAVWTGSEMIVWGGFTGFVELNTGGRYNPDTDSWTPTSIVNAPSARYLQTAVWTGNEMIVWAGIGPGAELNTDDKRNPKSPSGPTPTPTPTPLQYLNTGARYNPNMDSWTGIANAPIEPRIYHTAVWTGTEMIVWGGTPDLGSGLNSGGRYNPNTDSWRVTNTASVPSGRWLHTGVWTGSEMIVWGGFNGTSLNTGGKYDPTTDTWTGTSAMNAPDARAAHTAIWTDNKMIVWGGFGASGSLNSGSRYDPGSDSWTPTTTSNAPTDRAFHTAFWTSSEMLVWGGANNGTNSLNTGGRYNPNTDTWVPTADAIAARFGHTAVWTGNEMIAWGGGFNNFNSGGRYNPGTDTWASTSTVNAPIGREYHTAIWTGSEMIIWGGQDEDFNFLNTGGRYNPGADSWTATSTLNAPSARKQHTAVWADSEMIVWGGLAGFFSNYFNTGGRYYPGTDTWIPTTTLNAPSPRAQHTAVSTGNEMIVWGGYFEDDVYHFLNTGGLYHPDTDTWTITNTINAPSERADHTAVWTGSEMVVWGGDGTGTYFDTGGRYDPFTDNWTATSITNAPFARVSYSAVWTGSEMIIWGGSGDTGFSNTGGRYNPNTDSWTATSTIDAPSERVSHTAVWIGNEMIVWGGYNGLDGALSTGGKYCAQLGPTPTPTTTPRVTPRPRPAPHPRPTPP